MKRKGPDLQPIVVKFAKGSAPRGTGPAYYNKPIGGGQYNAGGGNPVRQGYNAVTRTSGAAVIGEMKYFDCDRSATAISACTTTWVAGTIMDPGTTINLGAAAVATPLCLFAPTVGAALNQRIGRKVKVLKIKVAGEIVVAAQAAQATGDGGSVVRLLLVQDCQTNSAAMTGAQLLNDGTAGETTVFSFQNPNNFGRFRVLKDKRFIMENPNSFNDAATTGAQNGLKRHFKFNVNFKQPIEVHFNATNGGTVADIVDNSFHIIVGTDLTNLAPNLSYYSRICYKE